MCQTGRRWPHPAPTPQLPHSIEALVEKYTKTGRPKNLFVTLDAIPSIPGFGLDKVGRLILENPSHDFVRGFMLLTAGFQNFRKPLWKTS